MLRAMICFRQYMYGSDYSAFPASGYRNTGGTGLSEIGDGGWYWSSSSRGQGEVNGASLKQHSAWVNPFNNNNRANAFPLRCVQAYTEITNDITQQVALYKSMNRECWGTY